MELIVWDESFSVGVKALDEQHKQLVKLVNKLLEMNNVTVDSEAISDALTEMTKYARKHFDSEEKLMLKYDYLYYPEQKEEHKLFWKKTTAYCLDAMSHKESIPKEILVFLKSWWVHHILETDMKYKEFFRERGVE